METTHVTVIRHEVFETQTPSLWIGLQQTDAEADVQFIIGESMGGKRLATTVLDKDEFYRLHAALNRLALPRGISL